MKAIILEDGSHFKKFNVVKEVSRVDFKDLYIREEKAHQKYEEYLL